MAFGTTAWPLTVGGSRAGQSLTSPWVPPACCRAPRLGGGAGLEPSLLWAQGHPPPVVPTCPSPGAPGLVFDVSFSPTRPPSPRRKEAAVRRTPLLTWPATRLAGCGGTRILGCYGHWLGWGKGLFAGRSSALYFVGRLPGGSGASSWVPLLEHPASPSRVLCPVLLLV